MGGRGSTGGNNPGSGKAKEDILSMSAQMKAARQREAAQKRNENLKKAESKVTKTPSAKDLDTEPMGAAYMSPQGTIYVKMNNANNADWIPYLSSTGTGYSTSSSEVSEKMKSGGFVKLGKNDTYMGAGSYRPTQQAFDRAKPLRAKASKERAERQKAAKAERRKKK